MNKSLPLFSGLTIMTGLIACSFASSLAFAAPLRPVQDGMNTNAITVTGHAELKVRPDIARVTLSVTTTSAQQTDAVHDNASKMTAVLQALAKSGIAAKDIHTSTYMVQPNYDYSNNANPPLLTGFTATNSVDVTIRDLSKAGLIVDKAVTAGATAADGLSFDLSDPSKEQGEALVAAVTNARSKADLIAGAAGVSLGRVLSISEQGAATPPVFPMFRMNAMAATTPAPTTPISAQEVTITADVTESFAISYGNG